MKWGIHTTSLFMPSYRRRFTGGRSGFSRRASRGMPRLGRSTKYTLRAEK